MLRLEGPRLLRGRRGDPGARGARANEVPWLPVSKKGDYLTSTEQLNLQFLIGTDCGAKRGQERCAGKFLVRVKGFKKKKKERMVAKALEQKQPHAV